MGGRIFCSLLLASSLTLPGGRSTGAEESWIAIVGVAVLAMDSSPVRGDQTIVIAGERIEGLGPRAEIEVPAGAKVIDGRGRFLMPGLVDVHVHLRHAQPEALLDYLRVGITSAREMNGRPFLLEWRDRIEAGDLIGPALKVAAPTLGNFSSPREGYPTPETAEQAREAVRRFHSAGYDWIKVYSFLEREAFEGVMEEARRLDIPVGGHVPIQVGIDDALAAGLRSIEHLTEYVGGSLSADARALDESDFRSTFGAGEIDVERLESLVRTTRSAGVWNVPTLVWFDRHLPTPLAREAWDRSELRKEGARNRRWVVGKLHEHGASLAVGTDSDAGNDEPARAIYQEIAAMVEANLSHREVLRAATIGGARLLGVEEVTGSIEVGKRADLLLLGCDPLERIECIADPELVIVRGRIVPRE